MKIYSSTKPYKTRYTVHWISPDGNDCLLGGSKTLEGASDIAKNQAYEIFDSPFETSDRKFLFLKNIYIWDEELEEETSTDDMDEYIDNLMSEISSKRDFTLSHSEMVNAATSLADVLNDAEGRELVDRIEELEDDLRDLGISFDDMEEFKARARARYIEDLKNRFGYVWK